MSDIELSNSNFNENNFETLAFKFNALNNRIESLKIIFVKKYNLQTVLNNQRNNLLDKWRHKLETELEKVNNIKYALLASNDEELSSNLNAIKADFLNIKLKSKSFRLNKSFDLLQLSKYYDLIPFKNINFYIENESSTHCQIISSNKLFIKKYNYFQIRTNIHRTLTNNFNLNSAGSVTTINQDVFKPEIKNALVLNNYILLLFEKFNEKNFLTTIKLYDYEYNLFKEIKIDDPCAFIRIVKNNDDFALQKHSVDLDVLIYEERSYDEPKSISLPVDEKPFYDAKSARKPNINQLIHFNDEKLYIDDKIDTVYVFNRKNLSSWEHFKYKGEIKFDEISRIYVCLSENKVLKSIEMRDLHGRLLGFISNPKFKSFEFDRFGNIILNKCQPDNCINYYEF